MKRCPQCYRDLPMSEFVSDLPRSQCSDCRKRKSGYTYTPKGRPLALVASVELRVLWAPRSGNKKLGKMPASVTSAITCPRSCLFYGAGCYAEFHMLATHWSHADAAGLSWRDFLARVRALSPGQVWRHNEAGDLPGHRDKLDVHKLDQLVEANRGRGGFTFTSKPLRTQAERDAIARANAQGFTVNLSAKNVEDADRLAEHAIGPVSVVVPSDTPARASTTPAGRTIVVCPAQTHALTCARCLLCTKANRKSIVAFRAHGQAVNRVNDLVTLRRSPA